MAKKSDNDADDKPRKKSKKSGRKGYSVPKNTQKVPKKVRAY